ncbi:MAG TPA: NAD(P)H-dependent oxidoreductase [Novosphingobium sp.]|nr:NAD(P)H-dependent oxidoreductase [Novosphingobium sp.]
MGALTVNVLLIDGHPDEGRLVSALLDRYQAALPSACRVRRIAVRDLAFDPNLRRGYAEAMPWEPDLQTFTAALDEADHVAIGFPLWWGAEPAQLKGLLDRVLLPGWAFRYHKGDPMWDRLLAGRSADLFVTMDTPPWYLRLVWGDPVMKRWKNQVLGFAGFSPIRLFRFGQTRRGGAAKNFEKWAGQLEQAAASCTDLKQADKAAAMALRTDHATAQAERAS